MQMLTPLEEHSMLLFWLQLLVLFLAARGLGTLAQRLRQPAVVGELLAGLVIGPSLFGRIAPEAALWLFPGDDLHSGVILSVAWVGVILLLIETGLETDIGLLRRIGRSTAMVPVGSLLLPLVLGIGMGFVMPEMFVSESGRVIFALFIGVCLAVSSLPVVAKILIEMGLMRRNVGQIIIVGGMADDIVGWIMLSTLAGAASSGSLEPTKLIVTIASIAGFIAFAFTLGQRGTNALLRRALRTGDGMVMPMTAIMLVVLAFAALTQAIGIEAVFGAFVAGIVLGRSRFFRREFEEVIHTVAHGFLAPVFFATAGMYVDIWQLADTTALLWTVIVIVVASIGKLVGSYVGARMGPLGHREAIAVGFGLNARGALEVIIATIALSIGVFNQQIYTIIVLLALSTSIMAPPFLRWALRRTEITGEEKERLDREELLDTSVLADARNALLPTRGGANSALAARILDLVLQPEAHVTVLTVVNDDDVDAEECAAPALATFSEVDVEFRAEYDRDPATAIIDEARLGYDLIAIGLSDGLREPDDLSDTVQSLLARSPSPLVIVRRGVGLRDSGAFGEVAFRRILVPVAGTRTSRAAEEVAYTLGSRLHVDVDAVHVVSRRDREDTDDTSGQLTRASDLAERMGGGASTLLRAGSAVHEEIVSTANERDADVIVLGAQLRTHDGRPFFGHGSEYVLEHADQTVIVVVFPEEIA